MNFEYNEPDQDLIITMANQSWYHIGDWMFVFDGTVYDLSAANLDMLEYIATHQHFVIGKIKIY